MREFRTSGSVRGRRSAMSVPTANRLLADPLREVCISESEPFLVAPGGFRAWGKS
jgi:hypothetical protein